MNLELLKQFIISQTAFTRYIESYGDINDIDYDYLKYIKVINSAFLLFLYKDNIIKKEGANLKNYANGLDEYCKILTPKINGEYKLGNATFKEAHELIHFVRNQLAHGCFNIKGNNVVFDKDGNSVLVDINKLALFSENFSNYWNLSKTTGENTRYIIYDSLKTNYKYEKIINDSMLKEAIRDLKIIKIKNNPKSERTLEESIYIEKGIEAFKAALRLKKEPIKLLENFKKYYKKQYNIEINYEIENADKYKAELKNIFHKKEEFNYLDYSGQKTLMSRFLYMLINGSKEKKNICFSCITNQYMANELEENILKKPSDIIKNSKNKINMAAYYENQIVSNYLLCFYVIYQLGLESIYKSVDQNKLIDIINMEQFDYSLLDFDQIKPSTIELIDKQTFIDQRDKMLNDLNKIHKLYNDKLNQYNNLLKLGKESSSLNEMLKIIKIELDKKMEIIYQMDEFINNHLDKYIFNKSLIVKLRNSMSHGKIIINSFNDECDILGTNITFIDSDGKNEVFKLDIKVRDFLTLISDNNLNYLYDYINIKDKVKTKD